MRIISESHDYYDSAMAHGADRALVYERRERVIAGATDDLGLRLDALPRMEHVHNPKTRRYDDSHTFVLHLLLFCGELLPFVVETHRKVWNGPTEVTTHWGLDALEAAVAADPLALKSYGENWLHSRPFVRKTVREIFGHRVGSDRLAAIHDRHGSPVILYRSLHTVRDEGVETVLDPSLRALNFQAQRDPFATFQTIAMYLGGVMRSNERPTVILTDVERRDKHGMDAWSFRTKVR